MPPIQLGNSSLDPESMPVMIVWVATLGLVTAIGLAEVGQVEPRGEVSRSTPVIADHLAVFDRPDERSFGTGRLARGDRVRVRGWIAGGWAAIDPPATTIGWIERASLELGDEVEEHGAHRLDPGEPGSGPPARAWVVVPRAMVRSGHLGARLPGPPWIEVPR